MTKIESEKNVGNPYDHRGVPRDEKKGTLKHES